MPMVDYVCDSCGYRFENYFHSDAPESQPCPHVDCSEGVACRIDSYPGEYQPTNAQRFDPIVLWVANDNSDRISVPGRADEPVEEGYHKVEITNMREADKWTKRMNDTALREAVNYRAMERAYCERQTKERREATFDRVKHSPRLLAMFKQACEYTDKKREKRYARPLDRKGHFQALSFDSSNRQGWADPDTGWKDRKS